MRIFVSSSFEDLSVHRAAAIRVLRQLGHEVLAMEDMIAGSAPPLSKVLEMVDRSDAYVGIFAWRYGHIPVKAAGKARDADLPPVAGAKPGETSITHYEYLRAVERDLPVLAFLLAEHAPWPPQYVDGFDRSRPEAPVNAERIRALRLELQHERVVSWFTTPSDLEARVSAAVTMAGLRLQLNLLQPEALGPEVGTAGGSDPEGSIKRAIVAAGDSQHTLKIDLATTWWSTRLFLVASLAQRLTRVRRILVVQSNPFGASDVPGPDPASASDEWFVGLLSTRAIVSTIGSRLPELRAFSEWLRTQAAEYDDVGVEIDKILAQWYASFDDAKRNKKNEGVASLDRERAAKIDLTAEILRRWFGEAMLQYPAHIADLQRVSEVDLLRLLDYPSEYVPVLTRRRSRTGALETAAVEVLEKSSLNLRLARTYLTELLDRARIR